MFALSERMLPMSFDKENFHLNNRKQDEQMLYWRKKYNNPSIICYGKYLDIKIFKFYPFSMSTHSLCKVARCEFPSTATAIFNL